MSHWGWPERTLAERFWSKVDCSDDCWIWKEKSVHLFGYGVFTVKKNNRWNKESAHRVSWQLTHGTIPKGMFVLHRCDNPKCVNPDHLFLGTQKDNLHDMLAKGRDVGNRRLTREQVNQIRFLAKTDIYLQRELATVFGCDHANISAIVRGIHST